MPLSISVKHDADKAMRQLREQLARRSPRALASGINRTANAGRTAAVRAIQADVGASAQKSIRANVTVKTASPEKLDAAIIARSTKRDRIPIIEISPRPRRVTKRRPAGGVSYGPKPKLLPGSFIAAMASGHVGVFKRIGEFGRRGNPKLEKIAELFGPSVALVLARKRVFSQVQAVIRERLPKEIQAAFRFAK
jgi:hypothetical protein